MHMTLFSRKSVLALLLMTIAPHLAVGQQHSGGTDLFEGTVVKMNEDNATPMEIIESDDCEYQVFDWPTDGKDPFGYDSSTNSHSEYWVADCWCIFNGWDNYQQAILDKSSSPYGYYATIDDPGGTPAMLTRLGNYWPYKAITCKRNC
ncbi:MAG: hypothetical protein RIE53_00815 [Rhodothermales bacterium]